MTNMNSSWEEEEEEDEVVEIHLNTVDSPPPPVLPLQNTGGSDYTGSYKPTGKTYSTDNSSEVIQGTGQDDVVYAGDGDHTFFGDSGDDTFVFSGGGDSEFHGGSGADTVKLTNGSGSQLNGNEFTIQLSDGSQIEAQAGNYVSLSQESSGTVTFTDGSTLQFDGVEKIEW